MRPSGLDTVIVILLLLGWAVTGCDRAENSSAQPYGEADLRRIIPLVRTAQDVANLELAGGSPVARRPFEGELDVIYVFDSDLSVQFIYERELDRLGVANIEELHELAVQNLRDDPPGSDLTDLGGGIFMVSGLGETVTSLLFAGEAWRSGNFPDSTTNESPVIAIPARDQLYVIKDQDPEILRQLKEFSALMFERSTKKSRLTTELFTPQINGHDVRWSMVSHDE